MKVLYVCTTGGSGRRQFGGAERILLDLIPAIASRGVDVLACTPDDQLAVGLREAGVPWTDLGAKRRVDLEYVRQIRATVESFKPDVVCVHLLSAAMHARVAMGLANRRTPLVITLHSSLWQHRNAAASKKDKVVVQSNIAIDSILFRLRPHATVAVSEFEARELRQRGRSDVHTIANSLPSTWPGTSGQMAGAGAPVTVGYLGRLEREKGADLISAIAGRLPDVAFKIAGSGSVVPAAAPNIELLGHVSAAEFLQQIDCLVVPSRVEAFGLSALEAMSMGVPVVHSGVGGLSEVTRKAEGTLAFQAGLDPDQIASRVREAITRRGTEAAQALAGQYAQEYSFGVFVDRWLTLYRKLADVSS